MRAYDVASTTVVSRLSMLRGAYEQFGLLVERASHKCSVKNRLRLNSHLNQSKEKKR
jgi:hypothetical protein